MYQPSSAPMLASIVHISAESTASMAYAGTTPQVGLALTIAQLSILCIEYHCQHNIFDQAHPEEVHPELHFTFTLSDFNDSVFLLYFMLHVTSSLCNLNPKSMSPVNLYDIHYSTAMLTVLGTPYTFHLLYCSRIIHLQT